MKEEGLPEDQARRHFYPIEMAGGTMGGEGPIHPNNDDNMSASPNDSTPRAMRIAADRAPRDDLSPAVAKLRDALVAEARQFADHEARQGRDRHRLCKDSVRSARACWI